MRTQNVERKLKGLLSRGKCAIVVKNRAILKVNFKQINLIAWSDPNYISTVPVTPQLIVELWEL